MLARAITAAIDGVSPGVLFQNGEPGVMFDPQDLRTLYQDAAGTTPVTGVEQPVGLMLDKSKGTPVGRYNLLTQTESYNHADWTKTKTVLTDTTAAGPFGRNTACKVCWTSESGFQHSISRAHSLIPVASGASITVHVWVKAAEFTILGLWVQNTNSNYLTIDLSTGAVYGGSAQVESVGGGWYRISFECTTAATSVSLMLWPGGYGTTAGDGVSGLYVGGSSIVYSSNSSLPYQRITTGLNGEWTPGNHATQSTAGSRPTLSARYNMLTGTDTLATQSVTTLATDYTLSFSGTGTVTLSGTATGAKSAGTNAFTATAGTLTLTVSGTVTNAQLVASNQASLPYQSVTSDTVYDSDPTKFPWYLRCTDHWMVTPSIDATAYDKVAVFAAIRKMSDAARGTVLESSATIASNNGAIALSAPYAASASLSFESKGTTLRDAIDATVAAPATKVLVGLGDISGDQAIIRTNGTATDADAGDQGTGNYGSYPLYIGKRAGTSLPFNGRFYGLAVRFASALPNDNVIAAISRYYAAKAGIKI